MVWGSKRIRTLAIGGALACAASFTLGAQQADRGDAGTYRTQMVETDESILGEVRAHSELVKNLDYLTSRIGARLTGTPQMEAAARWALQRFKDYGLDAHIETMTIAHAWYRGADSAAILVPIERSIEVRALGWSKATPGEVTASVVALADTQPGTIAANNAKLAGAVVLLGPPAEDLQPISGAGNAYDAVVPLAGRSGSAPAAITPELLAARPAVVLRDSGKIDSLFNMTSAGVNFQISDVPSAFVTHEDYSLLQRLARDGAVRMKVNLTGTFSAGEQPASIVVAEIKGSDRADQIVILGGHLDSWDLGQGALDNGTGATAVIEAARALKALGALPRRTLRFVLFPGEEQGLRGSYWYVARHSADLPKIDAMLVHDTGTGAVSSIALEGLSTTAPLMTRVYEPLQQVFALDPASTRTFSGSDHIPFLQQGVPAYFCVQKPARYGEAHHSETDTFDKVIPDEVNQGAAVIAAWAWNVSQLPESLHR